MILCIMALVAGLLSAVGSLMLIQENLNISLTWTSPFTLDLDGADPDITYCVGVVSSTSSATLHSECNIARTEFTYTLPPITLCDEYYTFTITPVNIVGNGTPSSLQKLSKNPSLTTHDKLD